MKLLTEPEFRATFTNPMQEVPEDSEPPCAFWDYFDAIPEADFAGHKRGIEVSFAWNNEPETYQHVLVDTEDENLFMVLVIDLVEAVIVGHRLVDIDEEYGGLEE
jgi:hypothetical protein